MTEQRKLQVVPGGTSGMGLATAIALGKLGPVLVGGRNENRLNDALEELKAAGVDAYGKTVDISDRKSVDEFVKYATTIAPIGNVVNAAAIDSGESKLIWDINVKGTMNVVEAFFPHFDGSKMVNFSSVAGYYYQPDREEMGIWSDPNAENFLDDSFHYLDNKELDERMKFLGDQFLAYIASKRFVMYYTMANVKRFGEKNSQIFSVAPGSFDTPMLRENDPENIPKIAQGTAFGRLGKPEEMASFILHLLSPGHEYLTGCDLILDGGKNALTMAKQL